MGVVVKRYIDLLIPTPLVSVLFLQQHSYILFVHFLNVYIIYIYIYIYQRNAPANSTERGSLRLAPTRGRSR